MYVYVCEHMSEYLSFESSLWISITILASCVLEKDSGLARQDSMLCLRLMPRDTGRSYASRRAWLPWQLAVYVPQGHILGNILLMRQYLRTFVLGAGCCVGGPALRIGVPIVQSLVELQWAGGECPRVGIDWLWIARVWEGGEGPQWLDWSAAASDFADEDVAVRALWDAGRRERAYCHVIGLKADIISALQPILLLSLGEIVCIPNLFCSELEWEGYLLQLIIYKLRVGVVGVCLWLSPIVFIFYIIYNCLVSFHKWWLKTSAGISNTWEAHERSNYSRLEILFLFLL